MRLKMLLICGLFFAKNLFAQYEPIKHYPFKSGEKYTYLVHYGFVNAGEAVVTLDKAFYKVNDRVCYKVDVTGKSLGVLAMTYKINNLWRSYIDTSAMIPQKFYRSLRENTYSRDENVFFDHLKQTAKQVQKTNEDPEETKEYKITKGVQDMISGYYLIRTLNFNTIQKGDTLNFKGYLDGKIYDFRIRYLGKEKIRTEFGKIWTAMLAPILPETRLFAGTDALKIWVSDDRNRIPVKIQAELFMGAIEIDLIEHNGLIEKFRK